MSRELDKTEVSLDIGRALAALSDDTCRRIIRETLSEPLTACELVERCDRSHSTVYRKLQTLVEGGVLTPSTRIRTHSKDATQFEPAADSIRIEFTEAGIELDLESQDGEPDENRMAARRPDD